MIESIPESKKPTKNPVQNSLGFCIRKKNKKDNENPVKKINNLYEPVTEDFGAALIDEMLNMDYKTLKTMQIRILNNEFNTLIKPNFKI